MALLFEWKKLNSLFKRWSLISSLQPKRGGAFSTQYLYFSSKHTNPFSCLLLECGKVELDILSPISVLESSARLATSFQASPFLPLKWELLLSWNCLLISALIWGRVEASVCWLSLSRREECYLSPGANLWPPGPSWGIKTLTYLYLWFLQEILGIFW